MAGATRRPRWSLALTLTAASLPLAGAAATPAGLGVPSPVAGQVMVSTYPHRVETIPAGAVRDAAGRVVVVGSVRIAREDAFGVALARFAGTGEPDSSFGSGGAVQSAAAGGGGQVVSTQPDGRLLVGGSASRHTFVARYAADGRLDSSFAANGVFAGREFGPGSYPQALAVTALSDGTIVAVLSAPQPTLGGVGAPGGLEIVRLAPDGGVLSRAPHAAPEWTVGTSAAYAAWSGAHVYADGSVVVAGSMTDPDPCQTSSSCASHLEFVVRRFLASGAVDTSFGTGGRVTTKLDKDSYAEALAVGGDGAIVVAGTTGSSGGTFAVARYRPNGSLDPTFGRGGTVVVPDGDAHTVGVASDGSIFLASGRTSDLVVLKLSRTGALAAGFGSNGRATSTGRGHATALLPDPDGGVTFALAAHDSTETIGIAVARYRPDGALDTAFGLRPAPIGAPSQGLLAVATRGTTIAAAGFVEDDVGRRGIQVAVVDRGQARTSFGSKGEATAFVGERAQANAIGIDPAGRVVVGGEATAAGLPRSLAVRFRRDGSLDPAFGSAGIVMSLAGSSGSAADLAILGDSRVLVLVRSADGAFLVRLTAGGVLDGSFGDGGRVALPLPGASALAPLADGAAAVVGDGLATLWIDGSGAIVKRANAVVAGAAAAGIAAQRDGSVVVAGTTAAGTALARLLPDATLDSSFGSGGIATREGLGAADVAVQRDGRIVVAVRERGSPHLSVARFLFDGRIDQPFGQDGLARAQPGAVASALATVPEEVVVAGTAPAPRGTDSALSLLWQQSLVSPVRAVLFHVTPHGVARRVRPGTQPAWSGVARSLAYVGDDDGAALVSVVPRSGGARLLASSPLPDGAVVIGDPQWSRDGKLVALQLLDADGASSIAVVGAGGGAVRRIDSGIEPSWLDGHRLAYVTALPTNTWKVRLADADSGITRPLTTGWSVATPARGQLLAVATGSGWVVVRTNGTLVRRLPSTLREVGWAPDGLRLAGLDRGRVAIVDRRGHERLLQAAAGAEARARPGRPTGGRSHSSTGSAATPSRSSTSAPGSASPAGPRGPASTTPTRPGTQPVSTSRRADALRRTPRGHQHRIHAPTWVRALTILTLGTALLVGTAGSAPAGTGSPPDSTVAWSPDGKRLAISAPRDGVLLVAAADGSSVRKVDTGSTSARIITPSYVVIP